MTKNKIEAYFTARKSLLEAFGVHYPELIEDYTNYEWAQMYGNDVFCIDDDGNLFEFESSNLIGESEGYYLFYAQNNGNIFYLLFHEDKKITDEDECEEKFG